ncbi:MAG: hypothetical protein WC595_04455 [Candidatus Nanoarchaeia archaeon]
MFTNILTDPFKPDIKGFIYLVHAPLSWRFTEEGSIKQDVKWKIERIKNPGMYYHASLIGNKDPSWLRRFMGGERKIQTFVIFGPIGLIIKPRSDSVIKIAWNGDVGASIDPDELVEEMKEYDGLGLIKKPAELLTQAKGWNHLVLKGDPSTEIRGVVYREEKDERRAKMIAEAVQQVTRKAVALVKIPAFYRSDKAEGNAFNEWIKTSGKAVRSRKGRLVKKSNENKKG